MRGSGVVGGSGFIESQTFTIAGNFASYTGTGPLQGGSLTTVTTTDPDTTVYSTTTDPNSANNSSAVNTIIGASIPALSSAALALLGAMLAAMALFAARR